MLAYSLPLVEGVLAPVRATVEGCVIVGATVGGRGVVVVLLVEGGFAHDGLKRHPVSKLPRSQIKRSCTYQQFPQQKPRKRVEAVRRS